MNKEIPLIIILKFITQVIFYIKKKKNTYLKKNKKICVHQDI
jgi:hypothetical protein